ncbi:condensation domain-containing protein, partial [Streptomyces alkaliphilus]|uniref:condensation domain-containing protein n=1 Tax=Streptomyces alkaliphilus TaxID=1472722 RepID=UPI002B20F89E
MSESPRFSADLGRSLLARWRAGKPRPTEAGVNPVQLGLRLFEEIHPGTAANILRFEAEVSGHVDTALLSTVLDELALRHAVLRTTFPPHDRTACVVDPEARPDLTVVDLTHLEASVGRRTALARANARAIEPMDLGTGPLWRVTVWKLSDTTSRLQVLAHHIVADGWSLGVFLDELSTRYAGQPLAPAFPLPPVEATPSREDLATWRKRLAGAPPLSLPTDRPRPGTRRFRSAHADVAIGADLLRRVRRLAHREDVTPFMVLLSALHLALSRTAGHSDITVGSPMAMRERHRAPGAIGPLATMLALRTDTTSARTLRDLLHAIRDTCLDAYTRSHVPFEAVVEQAGRSGASLFDVLFVLQPEIPGIRLGDLSVRPLAMAPATIRNDCELYLWQSKDGITGFLGYDTDLFSAETASLLADRFLAALTAITDDPSCEVRDVGVLSVGECVRLGGVSVSSVGV